MPRADCIVVHCQHENLREGRRCGGSSRDIEERFLAALGMTTSLQGGILIGGAPFGVALHGHNLPIAALRRNAAARREKNPTLANTVRMGHLEKRGSTL
jgi:hypothetical protein